MTTPTPITAAHLWSELSGSERKTLEAFYVLLDGEVYSHDDLDHCADCNVALLETVVDEYGEHRCHDCDREARITERDDAGRYAWAEHVRGV